MKGQVEGAGHCGGTGRGDCYNADRKGAGHCGGIHVEGVAIVEGQVRGGGHFGGTGRGIGHCGGTGRGFWPLWR